VCIDCEQCEIVCPVDAIFKDIDIPAEHAGSIEVNAAFFRRNKAAVGPVSLETAWAMVRAAHEYAELFGLKVSAVVVDEAGAPIAVGKMSGADGNSTELAFNKAYTAATFHMPTAELAAEAKQPWVRSLAISHRGQIMPVAGGLPILGGVVIVGGVGVAGATRAEQDVLCCRAAMAVLDGHGH
jgi:uncharacterized protein GlcG (DUF336 family)